MLEFFFANEKRSSNATVENDKGFFSLETKVAAILRRVRRHREWEGERGRIFFQTFVGCNYALLSGWRTSWTSPCSLSAFFFLPLSTFCVHMVTKDLWVFPNGKQSRGYPLCYSSWSIAHCWIGCQLRRLLSCISFKRSLEPLSGRFMLLITLFVPQELLLVIMPPFLYLIVFFTLCLRLI